MTVLQTTDENPHGSHTFSSLYGVISDYSLFEFEIDVSFLETFEEVSKAVSNQNSQVLNPSLLEKLYLLLVHLSDLTQNWSNARCSDSLGIKIQKFNYIVKFSDIIDVSTFLSAELSSRFKLLFEQKAFVHSESLGTQEEILLLLRCCMTMLPLLEVNPTILLEKCRDLLIILRRLCSPDIPFEHADSPVTFLCSVLEVFVDELLVHKELRQYFVIADDVSFTNKKLFKHHLCDGNIDVVLEVMCSHFSLSVHGECLRKCTSVQKNHKKATFPELSLTAAMALLGTHLMVSAPHMFQAYLISMVSRCIGMDRASDDDRVDEILKCLYISTFEKSSTLYTRHISSLKLDNHHSGDNNPISCDKPFISGGADCPSYESYIRPVTYHCINQVAASADQRLSFSSKTKSEFLSSCDAYMNENDQILNDLYKEEILSLLNSVVSQVLYAKLGNFKLHTKRNLSPQETHLLASIMNLMSNSLLKIIRCMHGRSFGSHNTVEGSSSRKEYDVIIGIIQSLLQSSDSDSTQRPLKDAGQSKLTSHKESKLMVIQLAGFLPFCYDRRHEYFRKGCIFMMMTLMNLIIYEDGNLEEFKEFLSFWQASLSPPSATKPSKVLDSSIIASRFLRSRKLHLSGDSGNEDGPSSVERCLKLLNVNDSDMGDLTDFVECKKGKDYSNYLKNRQKFCKWRNQKRAGLRRKRRIQTCKILNGMKT